MMMIYNLIISNVYLYVVIIVGLIVLTSILLILAINEKKRRKIKNDFIVAEKVEEELNKKEDSTVNNQLEDILKKMQEDIEMKPEDVVKKFEEEQEEKAIISYQELVDNVKSGKIEIIDDEQSDTNFVESLDADISSEPIVEIAKEEKTVTPEMLKEAIENISEFSVKDEPKKFKKSEIISPIFGIMNETTQHSKTSREDSMLDIMNTRDYNELTEEIKRQEEFLNALKEFRRNL